MKINKGHRIKIVNECIENNLTYTEVSKKYSTTVQQVQRWIQIYKIHGEEALLKTNKLNGKEKIDMIKSMINNNWSYNYTSIVYNVSVSSVLKWYESYMKHGPNSLLNIRRGRPLKSMDIKDKDSSSKELLNKKYDDMTKEELKELLIEANIQNYYFKRKEEILAEENSKKKRK